MKHLVIILLGLAAVVVVLTFPRIRSHIHPATAGQPVAEAGPPRELPPLPGASVASKKPVATTPVLLGTNLAGSNVISATTSSTNWSSSMAARYAELINSIRAARDN